MGDAAGVGPEIILKSLSHPEVHEVCHPIVIGDAGILARAKSYVDSDLQIRSIQHIEEAEFRKQVCQLPRP